MEAGDQGNQALELPQPENIGASQQDPTREKRDQGDQLPEPSAPLEEGVKVSVKVRSHVPKEISKHSHPQSDQVILAKLHQIKIETHWCNRNQFAGTQWLQRLATH